MKNFYLPVFLLIVGINKAISGEMIHPLDKMRILKNLPENRYGSYAPIEQRGAEYIKYLSPSLKIRVEGGMGSGTIIYYDKEKNLAYVASCGHLWNKGIASAADCLKRNIKCEVVTWYKNTTKLKKEESFPARVIFYKYTNDNDTSLIVFKPDWEPNYFPIAPKNYQYKINSIMHSCGCDGGKEVAHYEVKIVEVNNDIVTINNSPRPGRSGGGLIDENNLYIGTCWGTEFIDGSGLGYFTTLKNIHEFWDEQGYEFLLGINKNKILGKLIPIKDRNSPQLNYDQNYILAP